MFLQATAAVFALTLTAGLTADTAGTIDLTSPTASAAPAQISDRVDSRSSDRWTLSLNGGTTYRIVVDGDGDTDLDTYLYDENGNLIDQDIDLTDYCILDVTPAWTGDFTLEIRNLGYVYNLYELTVL